ncbi:glycosyltransferase [Membranicola marinus]|uniref:Glycosyltransferase n=1 Tax=Membranihabitans marinus TaxID=1227546 RepID=A0A953LCW1_9BACT|nr:glycosyltransferase [Membranihabitans marinus]MBY5959921.1 glycosyltransferase [Membranihabitans marinus]
MRIIIIGPAYPYRGGIADTNESLCQSLNENGHDASIITFTVQYPDFLFPGKSQYNTEPNTYPYDIDRMIHALNPVNWFQVARRINTMKPDLVIVRYWMPYFAPALGTIVRRLDKSIQTIAMCDNVIPHEKRPGDRALTTYFTGSFDGFITLSKTTLRELDEFTNKPKTSYPHPINKNLGEIISQNEARDHLDLDENTHYMLFFGLVRDYKGLDLTLQALSKPVVKNLNIHLLVVGEFYEPREKYDTIIDELGIGDQVTIIDHFIPTSEIKYYFSAADLIIQTYKTASQSGVSQIAYHFECPILVTDVGGLGEVVLHQKTGYVTEKDPEDIAHCIADYFENNRRKPFSLTMQQEKPKYSWKVFSEKIIDLYHQLQKTEGPD